MFEFPNKVYVSKIDIYETYHGGGVKAVKCYDVTGTWITLWSTAQVSVIKHSRIFSPSFTSTTTCFSNHIRLDIDCSQANSWVEIDAVMLHGYKDSPPQIVEVYLGLSDGVYSLEGFCNGILDGDCEVQVSGENLVRFVQVKMRPSEAPLQLCEVLVLGFKHIFDEDDIAVQLFDGVDISVRVFHDVDIAVRIFDDVDIAVRMFDDVNIAVRKFVDPSDRRNERECFLDGNYKCSKRACPAASCPVKKMNYRSLDRRIQVVMLRSYKSILDTRELFFWIEPVLRE
ncbi:hypothetical protein DPMN_058480 [Dreissena polymorpha]|uniref:Pappalysin-1 SD scarf domain-containing protein n=1 Tax=Dreissena polymorpha TaxID=45954 RepID=A0A9D4C1U4_DREPO|nr:hypothetical protein DPMN_058480 [Dreissena polymorpha]